MKTRQNVRNLLFPKILDTLGGRRKKHSVFATKFMEKKSVTNATLFWKFKM